MAKKQKKALPDRIPTKRQLSKWQREEKIRRIAIIASAVFLAGILSWVGFELYQDYRAKTAAWREVVIKVNDVSFNMRYFVDMVDIYTRGIDSQTLDMWGDYVAGVIAEMLIQSELTRQGAKELGFEPASSEIEAGLRVRGWPNDRPYRDIVSANLSAEKLREYFTPHSAMEQAHVQIVFVKNETAAAEFVAELEAGGNFTALAAEFSANSSVEGDLGWLPRELMPNDLIANVAFNFTVGELSQPIYDESADGYWLVMVVDRGERGLDNETREKLIDKRVSDWLEEFRKNSTIENLLTSEKKSWAIDRVLERR